MPKSRNYTLLQGNLHKLNTSLSFLTECFIMMDVLEQECTAYLPLFKHTDICTRFPMYYIRHTLIVNLLRSTPFIAQRLSIDCFLVHIHMVIHICIFFFQTVSYNGFSLLSPLAFLAALQIQQLKTILLMSF